DNTLIVGKMENLYKSRIYIEDCNIVSPERLLSSERVTIKIRGIGRNPELPVRIEPYGDGYLITCQDYAWAPAKGQPLVFYEDNLVLGGGIVVRYE
ncbi:MAG: tRNA-specific 2-thiouridylase, partial [Alistipes sp.]|nr:tRNA-specific 2-thiouridylase [Alistipes sp.]